jgi:hypothetical protein
MADSLIKVLELCSEGDILECVATSTPNCKYFTKGNMYIVREDRQGVLYILDDNCVKAYDTVACFSTITSKPQAVSAAKPVPVSAVVSGDLDAVLADCVEGDYITCTGTMGKNSQWYTVGKAYRVLVDIDGELCIRDDDNDLSSYSRAQFEKVQTLQPSQLAPREELDDKPRSIVDGDYSQYCTWDIEDPETKTSEWKPDTVREDIDIMESIRHACNRT